MEAENLDAYVVPYDSEGRWVFLQLWPDVSFAVKNIFFTMQAYLDLWLLRQQGRRHRHHHRSPELADKASNPHLFSVFVIGGLLDGRAVLSSGGR